MIIDKYQPGPVSQVISNCFRGAPSSQRCDSCAHQYGRWPFNNLSAKEHHRTVKSCIKAALDQKPCLNTSHTFSKLKLHMSRTRIEDAAWKWQLNIVQARLNSTAFACQNVCLLFATILWHRQSQVSFSLFMSCRARLLSRILQTQHIAYKPPSKKKPHLNRSHTKKLKNCT